MKRYGVDVYFEEQELHSTQPGADFYIGIYGSIAQSESENISANVRWGKEQSAKQGKVAFQYKNFLGYKKGEDGKPVIDIEQADVVKFIYDRYLVGDSLKEITKQVGTKTELGKYCGKYALTERLICGECKTPYRRCTWTVKGKKKIVWRCINRLDYGKKYCHNSPTIEENVLHEAIMAAIQQTARQNMDALQALKTHIGVALGAAEKEENTVEIEFRIAQIDAEFKSMIDTVSADTVDGLDENRIQQLIAEKNELQAKLGEITEERGRQQTVQDRLETIYTVLDGLKNRPMTYDGRFCMVKRIDKEELTLKELEEALNSVSEFSTVFLERSYEFDIAEGRRILIGADVKNALIEMHGRNVILDGQGNHLVFHCYHPRIEDTALIHICQEALGAEIRNLSIDFFYHGENTVRTIFLLRNSAYGVRISNCKLVMSSVSQINMTVLRNDRGDDTDFEKEGDNFVVENNDIRVYCRAESITMTNSCYGISNDLPNSMDVINNNIYMMVAGKGENQRVTGIYNNGRFCRILNNNIKANGMHMEGTQTEHTHAVGVENEGEYLLFNSNNCVAEWAGKAIGAWNKGERSSFTGNKFIGTHSIFGISLLNEGRRCTFTGNLFTSTSRNPRLVKNYGSYVSFYANILHSMFFTPDSFSGCGMVFEGCDHCVASGNQITGLRDCGIFLLDSDVVIQNNFVEHFDRNRNFQEKATKYDLAIVNALDESRIHSVD